jgi:hypothetical protein
MESSSVGGTAAQRGALMAAQKAAPMGDRSVDRRVVSKVDPTVGWKGVRLGEQ